MAVSCAAPLKSTTELELKLVPFTVNVKVGPPAVTVFGDNVVIVGTGLFTVKVAEFDVPPPGVGLVTVTGKVPAVVTSVDRIVAETCVEFWNEVARATPLKFTVEVETKLVPVTVRVNAPEPAKVFVGAMVVIVGTGLLAPVIVKVTEFDVPPPGAGVTTVTAGVPAIESHLRMPWFSRHRSNSPPTRRQSWFRSR